MNFAEIRKHFSITMKKFITPEFEALTKAIQYMFTINNCSFRGLQFQICLVVGIKNVRQVRQTQHELM